MDVWWRELTIWTLTDGNTYETPVIWFLFCLLDKTVIAKRKIIEKNIKQPKGNMDKHVEVEENVPLPF